MCDFIETSQGDMMYIQSSWQCACGVIMWCWCEDVVVWQRDRTVAVMCKCEWNKIR